jgi:hypothetical protein
MLNTYHSSLSPKHQWQSFPYHQYHHSSAINLRAPFSGPPRLIDATACHVTLSLISD